MMFWIVADNAHNRRLSARRKLIGRVYSEHDTFPPGVQMEGVEPRPPAPEPVKAPVTVREAYDGLRSGMRLSPWAESRTLLDLDEQGQVIVVDRLAG